MTIFLLSGFFTIDDNNSAIAVADSLALQIEDWSLFVILHDDFFIDSCCAVQQEYLGIGSKEVFGDCQIGLMGSIGEGGTILSTPVETDGAFGILGVEREAVELLGIASGGDGLVGTEQHAGLVAGYDGRGRNELVTAWLCLQDNTLIGSNNDSIGCRRVQTVGCAVGIGGGGHTFGQDPVVLGRLVKAVRAATKLPLIVKLAPNVPDLKPYTAACEENGADALALINTIPAMVIDVKTRRPVLANVTGGLSGRCVHPVAVKCVYDAHRFSKLPILAMGGVYGWQDAVELMLAGATAVAVGTATFTAPETAAAVTDGIAAYCAENGFKSVRELTGALAS